MRQDLKSHLRMAKWLAIGMDEKFEVGGFKFGLDPLIGLFPVMGDILTTLVSLYIVWVGVEMKLPGDKISQMVGNVVIDFLLDFIPGVGQIADFAFKSNMRNLKILEEFAPGDIMEAKIVG